MAIGKAEKAAYNAAIKELKAEVDQKSKTVNEIMVKKNKLPRIAGYYNIEAAVILLKAIHVQVDISDLSVEMLGIKNERFLNDARKEFYRVLQMMEEVVGNDVDRPLSENKEYLEQINRFNPRSTLDLVTRIDVSYHKLKNKFGEGSKWKWSFVELQARSAVICKNIINFSDVDKYRDPRSEFFRDIKDLVNMCKDGLTEAARQFRTKYEMAGYAREDLKRSIEFLSALRKIHIIFRETEEANKLKTIIDAGKQTLEAEDKKKGKNKGKNDKKKKKK